MKEPIKKDYSGKHVAIDFEYNARGDEIAFLICCAIHLDDGSERTYWLRDGRDADALRSDVADLDSRGFVFISHAMEIAEARCFKMLGLDPCNYRWRDTWLEASLLSKSFFMNAPDNCSLADTLFKYCSVQVDRDQKGRCRLFCINDETEGHEDEIMDYCASDVHYLLDLAEKLKGTFEERIRTAASIHSPCEFSEQTLVELAHVVNCSAEIAERGFPLDEAACDRLLLKVPEITTRLKKEFNQKYPGTFNFSIVKKTGDVKITRKVSVVGTYLLGLLKSLGLEKDWEYTAAGLPSTDSKLLKDHFKNVDNFGGDYYRLNKTLTAVQGISKEKDPWLSNWDRSRGRIFYRSLRPMRSSTGRCQPQPSAGFIPGWAHFLYCILNPKPNKMLFEIDFHSEETAIQAVLCKDEKYAEVYKARDIYLWMSRQLGQMTEEEYHSMPEDDSAWKSKFKSIRTPMKTFFLAWGYGAGAKKLAATAGIPEETAKKWISDLNNKIFAASYRWKQNVLKLTEPAAGKFTSLCFPDGYLSRTRRLKSETSKSDTTKMNFPFQGFGAYILRELIKECHRLRLPAIATVHDAIIFECDEGDDDMVRLCFDTMTRVAKELLGGDLLECGAPVFWHHHSFSDIMEADLDSPEGIRDFEKRVGDLVELQDVKKFRDFLK